MQIFIIGHRGTGKTSLLQRLQIYGRGTLPVFDLDREIESNTGQTVSEIFATRGEVVFRELEARILQHLVSRHPKMICALGAGFPLDSHVFSASAELVWVRRASDARGRIFLDRPRLDAKVSPLEEFHERFAAREASYARHCDWVYWLPEGLTSPCEFEKSIWGARMSDVGGILTLRPDHFRNPRVFRQRICQIDVDFFEMRDDLLSAGELEMAMAALPTSKWLVSLRRPRTSEDWLRAVESAAESDWALELNENPERQTTCVSLHESHAKSFEDCVALLAGFEKQSRQVKWSPLIQEFRDIARGLAWQSENPSMRSFLPRSETGRWSWVRLLLKDRQKFNFFRDGDGSALDQPTLHEWIRALSHPLKFAAVLGSPVNHSYSPMEHLAYARLRQMSFFAVDVEEKEWDEAIEILRLHGLRFAAVTSPLKKKAFDFADQKSEVAARLESANTLTALAENQFLAHNTDLAGFREMVETSGDISSAVIWGGGGVLPVIREVLPEAQEVSIRTGQPREEGQVLLQDPQVVIWAAPPEADLPQAPWRPKLILDLNYRDDSRAKEYAQRTGARYVSGLLMFHEQASAQREEWETHG